MCIIEHGDYSPARWAASCGKRNIESAQAAKSLTINDRGPSMPQAQTPQRSQPNGDHAESRTVLAAAAPSTMTAASAGPITRGCPHR